MQHGVALRQTWEVAGREMEVESRLRYPGDATGRVCHVPARKEVLIRQAPSGSTSGRQQTEVFKLVPIASNNASGTWFSPNFSTFVRNVKS